MLRRLMHRFSSKMGWSLTRLAVAFGSVALLFYLWQEGNQYEREAYEKYKVKRKNMVILIKKYLIDP
jgi:hypothetical protein